MRNYAHKSKGYLFVGSKGTGKTTLMMDFIRNYPAEQILIFDHQGEFAERLRGFSCKTEKDIDACVSQRKAVLYDPRVMFPGFKVETLANGKVKRVPWGQSEAFEFFCGKAFQVIDKTEGIKLVVWDETGTLIPSVAAYNTHSVRLIMETGRIRGCDLAFSAQQPNHLNNAIRQQVTEVFAFRHSDPRAAEWLVEAKGYRLADLQSLPDGQFMHHAGSTQKITRGTVRLGSK